MARRTRLCKKVDDTKNLVRATYDTAKLGCKVRVVGPERTDLRWNKVHEMYKDQVGTWEDILDKGWVAIYFHHLQTGELFMPDWLVIEGEV